jgi:hypothetical protein
VGSTIFQNKGPATVTIFGLGTANLTDPLITAYTDLNGPGGAARCGISGTGGTVMGTVNASCAGYTLASAIGPLSGTGTDNSNFSFATDQGMFHLSSVSTPSTFTATVPEPRSTAMLVISLALIGAYHRRKRQLSR